jgi:hypothetical protein
MLKPTTTIPEISPVFETGARISAAWLAEECTHPIPERGIDSGGIAGISQSMNFYKYIVLQLSCAKRLVQL